MSALLLAAALGAAVSGTIVFAWHRRERSTIEARAGQLASIGASAQDAIITTDKNGLISFWNMAAERMFLHSRTQALGQPLALIIPPRYREAHDRGMARVKAGGEKRVIGKTVELTALDALGNEFPVELSLSTFSAAGETYFSAIVRDIRARKIQEMELAETTRRLMEREHEMGEDLAQAEAFQRALLPPPSLSKLGRYAIDVLYEPDGRVGGDLYDVHLLPDGSARIFVADVTGHGVQASLRTIALKSIYDRHRFQAASPAELLYAVNQELVKTLGETQLLAGAACVDVRGNVLVYANAGLPLPVVLSGKAVHELEAYGSFLGASARTLYAEQRVTVAEPVTLVVHTDGVSYRSSIRADGALWRQIAGDSGPISLRVRGELARHADHDLPADDLTLVAVTIS